MKIKCRQGLCLLTSLFIASASISSSARAEEAVQETEAYEQDIMQESVLAFEDDTVQENENWLSVATEVLKYYAEKNAGLEPLITERNWLFYDVIPDKSINLADVVYFLNIYSRLSVELEFDGYIPKRNGEVSPVSTGTTTEETTIATTTSISTLSTDSSLTSDSTESTTQSIVQTTTMPNSTVRTTDKTTTSKTTTTKTTPKTSDKTTGSTTVTTITTISENSTESQITTTTVVTRTPKSNGIDVSVYQGNVDWEAVKESGVEFAIIRAGYGKHVNQEDRYFDINMKNAQKVGINCGAYWFSYATTPEDAIKEAEAFYEVIKGYKFEYPVFFDYETNAQNALKPEESTAIIHAFCKRMESYGYYVSLCSYVGFINYKIEPEILDYYDTWIAHYDVQVPWFSRDYGIWQYSCTGKIPGIDTDVDLNYAYRDYPSIMKNCHLNGF